MSVVPPGPSPRPPPHCAQDRTWEALDTLSLSPACLEATPEAPHQWETTSCAQAPPLLPGHLLLPPLLVPSCLSGIISEKPPGGDFQIANLFMLFFSNWKPCKSSRDKARFLFPHPQSLCGPRPHSRHACRPAAPSTQLAVPPASRLSSVVGHAHTLPAQSSGHAGRMSIWLMPPDACGQVLLSPVHCCRPLPPPRARHPVSAPTSLNEQPVDSQAGLVPNTTWTWVVSGKGAGWRGEGNSDRDVEQLSREGAPQGLPSIQEKLFQLPETGSESWLRWPAGRLAPRVRLMSAWTEGPSLSPGKQEGGLEEEDRRRDPHSSKTGSPGGPQRKAGMRSVWVRPPSPLSGHTWPAGQERPHVQTLRPSRHPPWAAPGQACTDLSRQLPTQAQSLKFPFYRG